VDTDGRLERRLLHWPRRGHSLPQEDPCIVKQVRINGGVILNRELEVRLLLGAPAEGGVLKGDNQLLQLTFIHLLFTSPCVNRWQVLHKELFDSLLESPEVYLSEEVDFGLFVCF
jgi:hypothetical protein